MLREEVIKEWKICKEKVYQGLKKYRDYINVYLKEHTFEFHLFDYVKTWNPELLTGDYNIIKSDGKEISLASSNANIGYLNLFTYRVRGIVTEILANQWHDNKGKKGQEYKTPSFPIANLGVEINRLSDNEGPTIEEVD